MAGFKADTTVIREQKALLGALKEDLKPVQRILDTCGSCGPGIEELQGLLKAIENTKAAMLELVVETIAFLEETAEKFDESDRLEAGTLSTGGDPS